jgi:hypothetical protein
MTRQNRTMGATIPIVRSTVDTHLEQLMNHAFAGPLSISRIAGLITPDPLDFARLGNMPPVEEGRLLEKAVVLLASVNPDRTVLVGCRLPLAPSGRGSSSRHYKPDLIVVEHSTGIAHLIDIKRSLDSYESHRIQHLKERMLSAAAGLPDFLRHSGITPYLREINIAVVSVDAARVDAERGVLSLEHLDRLLGVPDAGSKIRELQDAFRRRTKAQFAAALQSIVEFRVRERLAQEQTDPVRSCSAKTLDRRKTEEVVIRLTRLLPDDDGSD